ncbi:MAG TPA: alpha/beta fold hydrolase [Kofleriaceae bacterium]|nr:alpha/beta fold hydrolase [Kofleriaceae bacterium]
MRTAVIALIVAACSDPAPVAAPLVVTWTPCTLATQAQEHAECATVAVPYDWDDPSGRTIDLFVKRYHTAGSHGQLWFLQGGPGGSDRALDGIAELFGDRHVGFDYYMLDQRGTGSSTRLGCPAQEASGTPGGFAISDDEWPACLDAMQQTYEPTLAGFTVTNTARDLGELITATRGPDDAAIVYGVSYAPYMVNRYLQMFPDQPTAVVLDSICGPGDCSFTTADAKFDDVGRAFMTTCAADATCAAHLGSDPAARLAAVYDELDAGHCPEAAAAGLTRTSLRHAFAEMLYDWDERILIPPLVYRLDRCGAQDLPVLRYFGSLVSAPLTASGLDDFSTALFYQIALSELWDDPSPDAATFAAAEAHELMSNDVGVDLAKLQDIWPRAPHDAYYGAWAVTDVPMLMLGGSLDPATPLAFEHGAMGAFHGANQTFVTIPNASHGVLAESPTTGTTPCGAAITMAFVDNPTAPVDTSCVATVLPVTFTSSLAAMDFLNTTDLWGDGQSVAPMPTTRL